MEGAESQRIARRLEEVAVLLAEQGANPFRVEAYRGGAEVVRRLREPVSSLLAREGIAGLRALPGIGESLARSVRELTLTERLHHVLGLDSLEDLEAAAQDGRLSAIAGRLPILHTHRGARHYTVLYSNTARAHRLGKTEDWVVLDYDGGDGERQCTVVISERGPLRGRRVVRGREEECLALLGASS